MTVRDPLWLSSGVDAEEARLGNSAAWTPGASAVKVQSGVRPSTGSPLKVTQTGTASGNLLVAAGQCLVQGSESATQGAYVGTVDAQYTLTYLGTYPADTNPRKDIIVARVKDSTYSGASNSFTVEVIKGTAAGSPVDPTIPDNCLALARVNLTASATTVTDAMIDDLRTYTTALGGILPCTSSSRPSYPYAGQVIYETDGDDRLMVYSGSAWVQLGSAGAMTYTPSVTATGTNPTLGTGSSRVGWYTVDSGFCTFSAVITAGSSGFSGGSGGWIISLPVAAASGAGNLALEGWAIDSSATQRYLIKGLTSSGASTAAIYSVVSGAAGQMTNVTASAPFTLAVNDIVTLSGRYPV